MGNSCYAGACMGQLIYSHKKIIALFQCYRSWPVTGCSQFYFPSSGCRHPFQVDQQKTFSLFNAVRLCWKLITRPAICKSANRDRQRPCRNAEFTHPSFYTFIGTAIFPAANQMVQYFRCFHRDGRCHGLNLCKLRFGFYF